MGPFSLRWVPNFAPSACLVCNYPPVSLYFSGMIRGWLLTIGDRFIQISNKLVFFLSWTVSRMVSWTTLTCLLIAIFGLIECKPRGQISYGSVVGSGSTNFEPAFSASSYDSLGIQPSRSGEWKNKFFNRGVVNHFEPQSRSKRTETTLLVARLPVTVQRRSRSDPRCFGRRSCSTGAELRLRRWMHRRSV